MQPTHKSERLTNQQIIKRIKDILDYRMAAADSYREAQETEKVLRLETEISQLQTFLEELGDQPAMTNIELIEALNNLPRANYLLDYTNEEWDEQKELGQIH